MAAPALRIAALICFHLFPLIGVVVSIAITRLIFDEGIWRSWSLSEFDHLCACESNVAFSADAELISTENSSINQLELKHAESASG